MTTNAPPGLGDFRGQALDNHVDNAFSGAVGVQGNNFNTVFASTYQLKHILDH